MSKTITIRMSSASIQQAIKELGSYKKFIEERTQLLVQRLAEAGFDIALRNLSDIYYSGDLINSLNLDVDKNYACIHVDNEHAVFVEFGTGPVGAGAQHPDNKLGYQYNVGKTIGWYQVGGSFQYGWFYYDDYAGKVRFTSGMESRPFMWGAAQEMRLHQLEKIAREVFR